jgi:hypothetical protein
MVQSVLLRATGWTAGVRFPTGARDFSLVHSVKTVSRPTQPPLQGVPGAKWPVREADHSPQCNADGKNGGAIPPLPVTSSWPGA